MSQRTLVRIALGAMVFFAVLTGALVSIIPAEAILGDRIKLPIFHGALTWTSLASFTFLGLTALGFLALRRDAVYGWEVGFRAVSSVLWVISSVLGFIAALNTWDFTASKSSPGALVMQDPRLMAQLYVLLGVAALLAIQLLVDTRTLKAVADAVFVAGMWLLVADLFIDPGKRALHPDSPVLNSDDLTIKLTFFGIALSLLAISVLSAWLVSTRVAAEGHPLPVAEEADAAV